MSDTVPFNFSKAITPSDSVNFAEGPTNAIYVGGAGAVVVVYQDGTTSTLAAVPAGTMLNIKAKRVNSTSTTATNLVAMYSI